MEKTNLGQKYNDKGWDLQNGLTSGTPDPDAAIEWYEKAVECGNTTAMVNLGNIYESREEYDAAYGWYLEAALADNEQGMFNVANMHFWGWHVPQDYQKAYDYFSKLNQLGVKGTYYYLGLYAENGYLGEPDYEKAKYCYTKGFEEGDIYCPVNLGRMYCLGLGGPVDYKKGFELYYQGYLMGDVLACANLGYCYETGQGVEKDMEQALLYYKEGAEKGEENCIEAEKRLLGEDKGIPPRKEIDVSCRDRAYTYKVSICQLPADDEQMSAILEFLDFVKERTDVSVEIRIEDEKEKDNVPLAVLLADSPEGYYMELEYPMDDWEWDHPLLLANDHLTKDEATSVLVSIFYECTDDVPIVFHNFGEISSIVFPKTGDIIERHEE